MILIAQSIGMIPAMQTVPLCILSIRTIIIPLRAQAFELVEQYYGDVADIKSPVQY